MDDMDPFTFQSRAPTANRPLLGATVLVVEDSRFASEALRLLCLRSGARIRRADSLRSARRHLQVYRPTAVVVDIGLRDGSGADLIRELSVSTPHCPIIVGISGDPDGEAIALEAGAHVFMAKPITSLASFQETILQFMPPDRQPPGPRVVSAEDIAPDRIAYQDDLAHMADVLRSSHDTDTMEYVTQFLGGVARSAKDGDMIEAIDELSKCQAKGRPMDAMINRLTGLVQARLEQSLTV